MQFLARLNCLALMATGKALPEVLDEISRPKTQFMEFNFGQDNGQFHRNPIGVTDGFHPCSDVGPVKQLRVVVVRCG